MLRALLTLSLGCLALPLIAQSGSQYFDLARTSAYTYLEYLLLNTDAQDLPVYVLNQPYTHADVDSVRKLNGAGEEKLWQKRMLYLEHTEGEQFGVQTRVGVRSREGISPTQIIDIRGYFSVGKLQLVNHFILDSGLEYDPRFYGDTREWLMGYFNQSYALWNVGNLDVFAGRAGRNLGVPSEYSLIYSNNMLPLDHYGFSHTGRTLKYSFYVARLSDMLGNDSQGILIPIGEAMNTRRYFSIQRLDMKLPMGLQLSFSESIVYGGPDRTLEGSYLNPVLFYYAAQRNQRNQMNGFWQVSAFWKARKGLGFYLDLFADDIVVNNDPNVKDTDIHPQRFGVLSKISYALATYPALLEMRYVRIWNDTYTSYRNFENYVHWSQGIGYPHNSWEAVRSRISLLGWKHGVAAVSAEWYRRGDRTLTQLFADAIEVFPAPPVVSGQTYTFQLETSPLRHLDATLNLEGERSVNETENGTTIDWTPKAELQILFYLDYHHHWK